MANHNTGGITAPRPQHMERILGDAQNGHGLWLEQAPLMKLTHPCQCNCCSGNNMLLQPLPTAAELAAALAPDAPDAEKAGLEQSLVKPLSDMEVDFEALVAPKRQNMQSMGPFLCCGVVTSCAVPPVIGLICCLLCVMPACEKSLFVEPIKAQLPDVVAKHQAAFATAGVDLAYATDVQAHSDEASGGALKTFRDKKYDHFYSAPAVTFCRAP
jgi:hypothetical protein|mmetsp:Transcript_102421/g.293210  ORF Transcript_102421/g.293210 Transcript_102421/m.293210 type:complete len:214 (+) Transcript_102421:215-856(+)